MREEHTWKQKSLWLIVATSGNCRKRHGKTISEMKVSMGSNYDGPESCRIPKWQVVEPMLTLICGSERPLPLLAVN